MKHDVISDYEFYFYKNYSVLYIYFFFNCAIHVGALIMNLQNYLSPFIYIYICFVKFLLWIYTLFILNYSKYFLKDDMRLIKSFVRLFSFDFWRVDNIIPNISFVLTRKILISPGMARFSIFQGIVLTRSLFSFTAQNNTDNLIEIENFQNFSNIVNAQC